MLNYIDTLLEKQKKMDTDNREKVRTIKEDIVKSGGDTYEHAQKGRR